MGLRPYQQAAHDATTDWIKQSLMPCLIEAATGAGKSHIIAALAATLHKASGGKHVLCLAPSAELVTQNREKYLATGSPASVYSASAGSKCLKHPVVFATPGTFKGRARSIGHLFCVVILDEAHRISPVIKNIIEDMRQANPRLRVIGTTATPYRTGTGYIYQTDEIGNAYGPEQAIDPYFARKVYTIRAHELLDRGYLTPPLIGAINGEHYETLHLELNKMGQFDAAEVDRAFVGRGRKTAAIVADVVAQSRDRNGVMLFAATRQHAAEVMESLPPELSAIVTGETKKTERDSVVSLFKSMRIKYLVNVGVFTTGFDAPHVDVIALLRATESESLLQQIAGRGMRLFEGKDNFLVLDYAQNLERHCPDGDLFNPAIKTRLSSSEKKMIEVECPSCHFHLSFTARPNDEGYQIDKNGYFHVGGQLISTEHGPLPAHFGRRCYGMIGQDQCDYRWTLKKCFECEGENDIAARYCTHCKAEIVDPNEKLVIDFKKAKKDPNRVQTDRLISYAVTDSVTQRGDDCKIVDFVTDHRTFRVWYREHQKDWVRFVRATDNGTITPETITYKKEIGTIFYRVMAYNLPEDTPESIAA